MSKISELSNGGALLSTDDLIVVRSGGNVRAQMSALNGVAIGASTAAAGSFTTLTASGSATLSGSVTIANDSDPTLLIRTATADQANSGKISFREASGGTTGVDLRYNGSTNTFIIDTSDVSNALTIARTTGNATFGGSVTASGAINNIQTTTGTGSSAVKNLIYNYGGGDAALQLSVTGSIDYYLGVDDSDDAFKIGMASWDSSPYLTINSSGSVGIGTSNPAAAYGSDTVLEVSGASSPGIVINDTGQAQKYGIHADSNDLKITYGSGALVAFQNDGNVGIGESSPLGKLHVKTADSGATADVSADELVIEGSANAGISILSGASSNGNIYFGDSGTNWDGYIAYSQANRRMTFGVAAGGNSVNIDSTGVGIGQSSPGATLDILTAANTQPLNIKAATDGYNYVTIENAAGNDVGYFGLGSALVSGGSADDFAIRAQRNDLVFLAGGASEAMRITSGGAACFGASSPVGTCNIFTYAGSTPAIQTQNLTTGTTNLVLEVRNNGTSTVGTINATNTSTEFNTSSDQRLKLNIQDAKDAGELIDAIQVRQFDWKVDGEHQRYGMVAQELTTVAPEAVYTPEDPDEMMGVDYSKLVPMLIKEIQTLRNRVAQLEQ